MVCGFCSALIANGLGRFAYTPLLPALVAEHWFTASAAAYLGAANLAGYLAGALLGSPLWQYARPISVLRATMLLTAVSLLACAARDFGFAWFFAWRFLAGITGGIIMVTAAPVLLSATPASRRGTVSGVMFAGVGFGIALSGTMVPALMQEVGLANTWIGLGLVCLILTAVGWSGWPAQDLGGARDRAATSDLSFPAVTLIAQYGLNAVGLVPHMLFLVDYVARGLGRGLAAGGLDWVLFGIAASVGPLLAGRTADRFGFRGTLQAVFCVQAAAVAIPVITSGSGWIMLSSIVAGACVPGISTLVLGRILEVVEGSRAQGRTWGYATICWAIAQALGGYGYSYLFAAFGSYSLLFGIGACALALAFVLELGVGRIRRLRQRASI
jgi:predicted MFS family arabinose efflux permease